MAGIRLVPSTFNTSKGAASVANLEAAPLAPSPRPASPDGAMSPPGEPTSREREDEAPLLIPLGPLRSKVAHMARATLVG